MSYLDVCNNVLIFTYGRASFTHGNDTYNVEITEDLYPMLKLLFTYDFIDNIFSIDCLDKNINLNMSVKRVWKVTPTLIYDKETNT